MVYIFFGIMQHKKAPRFEWHVSIIKLVLLSDSIAKIEKLCFSKYQNYQLTEIKSKRTIENIWGNVIVFRLCMDWKVQRLVDGTEWGILRRISMDLLNIETRCIFSDFKIQFPFKFYGCSASLLQCEPLVVVSTARCFRNIIIILSEPGVLGDHVTCEIFID